ncbi:response regulator [Herbaspirillum sp. GCM10030257]|uniref:response regulator n=1 Tax=Herbaspirillum sp. GCM10030257 TaxID=3273393 RepID=UPI00360F139F
MEHPRKSTILIVDDEERNRKLLEVFAQADGYHTLVAASGEAGLAIAIEQQPDLVLLDLMMPVMDGFEVARALKSNMRTQHIPVLIVSSLDDPASRNRLLASGADKLIVKPIDRWQLSRGIADLMKGNSGG